MIAVSPLVEEAQAGPPTCPARALERRFEPAPAGAVPAEVWFRTLFESFADLHDAFVDFEELLLDFLRDDLQPHTTDRPDEERFLGWLLDSRGLTQPQRARISDWQRNR